MVLNLSCPAVSLHKAHTRKSKEMCATSYAKRLKYNCSLQKGEAGAEWGMMHFPPLKQARFMLLQQHPYMT